MEDRRERSDQLAAHVSGELIGATDENSFLRIIRFLVVSVFDLELLCGQAGSGWAVGDPVVVTTPDERDVAGRKPDCRLWVFEP
jgi:hypothetical protein